MKEDNSSNIINLHILGLDLRIKSDEEGKVKDVGKYLINEIERIRERSPALNRIDLSIMAAFKITNDLFSTREELDKMRSIVEGRSASLASKIEDQLKEMEKATPPEKAGDS